MNDRDFIAKATKIAERSSIRKHKTGAIIVQQGEDIISNGWSHVPHYKLRSKRSLHAEMHALARARHLDLRNAEIFIITIAAKSGNVVASMPCLDCAIALRAAGIRTVWHSTHDSYTCLFLDDTIFSDLKVYELNGT